MHIPSEALPKPPGATPPPTPPAKGGNSSAADDDPEPPRAPLNWKDVQLTEAQKAWGLEQTQQAVRQVMFNTRYAWERREAVRRRNRKPTVVELFRRYLGLARRGYTIGTEQRAPIPQFASLTDPDGYQQQIRQVLWECCLYFAQDNRWLELNPRYTFAKGLLFQGGLGVGKTTFLELFTVNPVRGYSLTDTAALNKEYLKAGPNAELHKSLEKPSAWGIDELGQEAQTVQYMGNWVPVLEEVLSTRARLAKRYPDRTPLLHATTNLQILRPPEFAEQLVAGEGEPNSIELHYGNRVLDRFRELFNQVEMPALPSFR